MEAKGKIYAIVVLMVLALAYTVWCLIDGTYYLALLGLFIFGSQVYNYISIKKKK